MRDLAVEKTSSGKNTNIKTSFTCASHVPNTGHVGDINANSVYAKRQLFAIHTSLKPHPNLSSIHTIPYHYRLYTQGTSIDNRLSNLLSMVQITA